MGGCGVHMGYPGKTLEQAKKLFSSDQDQALWESGHNGYSGTIGELSRFTTSSVVYDVFEDFQEAYGRMDKNHGLWAQVKVIRRTKPLEAAGEKRRLAYQAWRGASNERKAPSVLKTLWGRYERALERERAVYRVQAQKSTKTTWYVGGIASS